MNHLSKIRFPDCSKSTVNCKDDIIISHCDIIIINFLVILFLLSSLDTDPFSCHYHYRANIYLLITANNRNTRKRSEICSKITINTPERSQWRRSRVFIVNFEHISHFFFSVSIVDFEQVNVSGVWFLSCDNY